MGEVAFELPLADQLEERHLRVQVGDEDPRYGNALAVGELDRAGDAAADLDPGDGRVEPNLAAVILEEAHHRLGEDVRAADADPPAVRLERAGEHDRVVGAEAEDVAGAGELCDPEAEPRLRLR